jgi:ERCC4-related helicase
MHLLHALLSNLRTFGELRGAAPACIDILPFQLEPALAMISGRASRFLLADEVGLGKTIQAGLMIVELQHRGWCERALIITPAGLRRQWAEELHSRFDLHSVVVDAAALSSLTNHLPHDVNPWTTESVFIASIDFIKQPEVLRGLCSHLWDMVIVDEAHQASTSSLRREAVKMLADRSRHVVLLTATPHAGDDAAYRALCELGKLDGSDRIVRFRRTRQQVGLPRTRRVHLLPVRPSPEEMEMHRQLASYVARLWRIAHDDRRHDLQLVAMVLSKRAFSSPRSLAASIDRRLQAISGSLTATLQRSLPFDDDTDSTDEAPYPGAPAFDRPDEEEAVLRQLLDAATRAQTGECKVRALRKVLRRVPEPIVVFTEYRDTLALLESAVADRRRTALLHGGQTPDERRSAVEAFVSGEADLLLATDAGSEGLNLQSRCRLVINLELPWNPTRLEQRIGRVDRIGQSRTVHAINLFAAGTAESTVLAALLRRFDRIHASEIEIAASVISNTPLAVRNAVEKTDGSTETVDLTAVAHAEAIRIGVLRRIRQAQSPLSDGVIPVAAVRSPPFASRNDHVPASVIWFIRVRLANSLGRIIEDRVIPLADRGPAEAGHYVLSRRRRDLRAAAERVIDVFGPAVLDFATQLSEQRAAAIKQELAEWLPRPAFREDCLARMAVSGLSPLVQPGLFDRRALRREQLADQQRRAVLNDCAARATSLEATATPVLANKPEIAFLLFM